MNSDQNTSLWPQFLLLLALFVLCLFAPGAWQSRQQSSADPSSAQPANRPVKSQSFRSEAISVTGVSSTESLTVNENPLVVTAPIDPVPVSKRNADPAVTIPPATRLLEHQPAALPPIACRQIIEPKTTIPFNRESSSILATRNKEISLNKNLRLANNNLNLKRSKSHYPGVVEMISYRVDVANNSWPNPVSLRKQLDGISVYQPSRSWVKEVKEQLELLLSYHKITDPQAQQTLSRLATLVKSGNTKAEATLDPHLQSSWLRTVYALDRRLTVWNAIYQIVTTAPGLARQSAADRSRLNNHLVTIRKELKTSPNGKSWTRYLLIEKLLAAANPTQDTNSAPLNSLACQVLNRLNSPVLSAEQRHFVSRESFQTLQQQLQQVITSHLEPVELLRELEQYETEATADQANILASKYQLLRWALNDNKRNLARQLDTHYRNANIRIAVSEKMINRLLPIPKPLEERVDDTIFGARIFGKSRTSTILKVLLVPDQRQWRLGLQASGKVESSTETQRRVVTFHQKGSSRYIVNKVMQVDQRGIRIGRAIAHTDIHSELLGFETDFDSLPLVGTIIRSFVRHQYNSQSVQARDIYENRISGRARTRFDKEIAKHLVSVEERFQSRYLDPLKQLNLAPVAVDLQTTTAARLILRYRLAGNRQMAAHTPRPRAPGNSLLSIQIHESALNNTLHNLKLDGKRTDLRTFYRELADAFGRTDISIPEEIPSNVTISMADREAVRIRFEDGKVNLRIHLKELKSGKRHQWKNFVLTVSYRPSMDQLTASLYRDGHLQFEGKHLRLGDRIALQGIFNKALPRKRPVNILNKSVAEHAGMQDLTITQFVVDETWIGVAIGPAEIPIPRVANLRKDPS